MKNWWNSCFDYSGVAPEEKQSTVLSFLDLHGLINIVSVWSCHERAGALGCLCEGEFNGETDQFSTELKLLRRGVLMH